MILPWMAASNDKRQRRKILLLTGAPRRQDLSWTDDALDARSCKGYECSAGPTADFPQEHVQWRKLPMQKTYLHTGLTQTHCPEYLHGPHVVEEHQSRHVLAVGGLAANISTNGERGINTTWQVEQPDYTTALPSYQFGDASLSTTESLLDTPSSYLLPLQPAFDNVNITNLADLPGPEALEKRGYPHSTIFNLLVIVLAISIERMAIMTENGKTHVDLARLFVADETKSAFEIAVWLDCIDTISVNPLDRDTALRTAIENVKRFDIVLVQNLGLRSFKKQVHACSLRKMTKIHQFSNGLQVYRKNVDVGHSAVSVDTRVMKQARSSIYSKMTRIIDWRDNHQQVLGPDSVDLNGMIVVDERFSNVFLQKSVQFPADTQ